MSRSVLALVFSCVVWVGAAAAQPASRSPFVPRGFVENLGQYDSVVRYLARVDGAGVFLTDREVRFALASGEAVFMHFESSTGSPRGRGTSSTLEAREELAGRYHFLFGNDPSRWTRDARAYSQVIHREVAPHIDAVFRIRDQQFEYDLFIHPGARPEDLRIVWEGVRSIDPQPDGSLRMHTERGWFSHGAIRAFEVVPAESSQAIPARLEAIDPRSLRIVLPGTVPSGEYVLDPALDFSTYLGWSQTGDIPFDVAVSEAGNVYAVGMVFSSEFPISPGTYTSGSFVGGDAMIVQLDSDGTTLIYSTAIGGLGGDIAYATHLFPDGRLVVAGSTDSPDFPVTAQAYSQSLSVGGAYDAFVLQLSADGSSLSASTYFGAPGASLEVQQNGLAVDSSGRAYIVGESIGPQGIPTTPDAVFPTWNHGNCSLAILSPDLSTLQYCTYIGGIGGGSNPAVAVDAFGGIVIAGQNYGQFPVTAGAFDVTHSPGNTSDFFVIKLKPMGQGIRYATYLGGIDFDGFPRIAVTADGKATVMGYTYSFDYPATPGSFDPSYDGISNVTLSQLNAQGNSLIYSGFLHSGNGAFGQSLKLDPAGCAYVAGRSSPNFITTPDAFDPTMNGPTGSDAILARIDPTGSSVLYATFFGGTGINTEYGWAVGVNSQRETALVGVTDAFDLPVTPGAYQQSLDLGSVPGVFGDGFVAAFDLCNGSFSTYGSGCAGIGGAPTFIGSGCPAAGSAVSLSLTDAPPGAPGALFLGLGSGILPLNGSCALQIAPLFPAFTLPFVVPPSGSFSLGAPLPVPLPKTSLYFQVLVADSSAPAGIAASAPLRMTIGD